MRFAIAMLLTIGMWLGTGPFLFAEAPPSDAFQGAWQLSGGEVDGKALTETQIKDGKLVIEGDQYTFTLAPIGTITGTQQLGSQQALKTIDITNDSGAQKGETCLGIYEITGDEFRVIFAPPGGERPTRFETSPESGQWIHRWKRIQK